jgi:hypothetical protein
MNTSFDLKQETSRAAEPATQGIRKVLMEWKKGGVPLAALAAIDRGDWERQLRRVNDALPRRYRFLKPRRGRRWSLMAAAGLGATAAAFALYRYAYRPWERTWGASEWEARRSMPGDDLVASAAYQTTRAISIPASRENVWPWLVQIGRDRGGFYGSDLISGRESQTNGEGTQIRSEFQELNPGDTIRLPSGLSIAGRHELEVAEVQKEELLVLRADGNGSWAFLLEQEDPEHTRLTIRTRMEKQESENLLFFLERGLLLGIKRLARTTVQ